LWRGDDDADQGGHQARRSERRPALLWHRLQNGSEHQRGAKVKSELGLLQYVAGAHRFLETVDTAAGFRVSHTAG